MLYLDWIWRPLNGSYISRQGSIFFQMSSVQGGSICNLFTYIPVEGLSRYCVPASLLCSYSSTAPQVYIVASCRELCLLCPLFTLEPYHDAGRMTVAAYGDESAQPNSAAGTDGAAAVSAASPAILQEPFGAPRPFLHFLCYTHILISL